jgi:DNA-binding CsgD family transcriptional regulator
MADVDAGREVEWTPAHQSVLGAAMYKLTPKQREIASLYYIGRVARKNLPGMLNMPLSTVDTHIRDINAQFRSFVGEVESGGAVQASWLGEFLEVSAMGRAKASEFAKGKKKGA